MVLKLFGGDRSRASIVKWYLEELNVPYEFVRVDLQAGEHLQPPYLAINPMGKVPAIEVDGFQIWESGAILLYLADRYGEPMSAEQRGTIAQWVVFANATLGPGIFMEATREKETPRLLGGLERTLEGKTFLFGDAFSAADVAVGSLLAYTVPMLKMEYSGYPAIAAYLQRLAARPAYQAAIAIPITA